MTNPHLGRYLVFDEIASGGMATVHFGRLSGPAGFSRVVAIKRLHPNYAKDPDFVAMLLDEARLAARIRHPNVVAMLDIVATGGETLLVMDYVHGESLAKLWRAARAAGEQVDPRVVATIMTGVLHGLHAAHEAKGERGEPLDIVHRDVSPQNILVGADGVARVHDFGVAKAAGRVQTTREGRIKGKLAYMPPEQLHGTSVTRRTDVYAAAVVTWELLTGRRAFGNEHEAAIITAVLAGTLSPPSRVAPHVPPAFDEVVMRGLHRNPARRYATARDMAVELERCIGIASMSEVSSWVHDHAHKDLVRRALRIAAIEAAHDGADVAVVVSARDETTRRLGRGATTPAEGESSGISRVAISSTLGRLRRRWRERVAVASSAAVASLLLALLLVRSVSQSARPLAPSPAASALLEHVDHSASLPVVAAPIMPAPAQAAPSPPPAPEHRSGAAQRGSHAAGSPAHAAKPKGECDPPFTIDDSGHKHYKPACFE